MRLPNLVSHAAEQDTPELLFFLCHVDVPIFGKYNIIKYLRTRCEYIRYIYIARLVPLSCEGIQMRFDSLQGHDLDCYVSGPNKSFYSLRMQPRRRVSSSKAGYQHCREERQKEKNIGINMTGILHKNPFL